MNCNCTKEIVDQKMLLYNYCASIQTANNFLSRTALGLSCILNENCTDDSSMTSEMIIGDHDGTKE